MFPAPSVIRGKQRKAGKEDPCTKGEALVNFCDQSFSLNKNTKSCPYLLLVFFPPSCFFTLESQWSNSLKGTLSPPARFYWFLLALPHWVPTTPEVMLFVWGSGVVPISVKKAPLSLIPTRRRTQVSSPQRRPGQPPPSDGTLSSFVRRSMSGPPEGRGAPTNNEMHDSHCMTPPWEGHGWLRWVGQGREGEDWVCNQGWLSYPVTE